MTKSGYTLYYHDLLSNSHCRVWVFEDEEPPTMVKEFRSVKNKMIAVVFIKWGIIEQMISDRQKTVMKSFKEI